MKESRSENGRLLSASTLPCFPPPQLPFKTDVDVEGFWPGDYRLLRGQQSEPPTRPLPYPLICYLSHSFAHVFDILG